MIVASTLLPWLCIVNIKFHSLKHKNGKLNCLTLLPSTLQIWRPHILKCIHLSWDDTMHNDFMWTFTEVYFKITLSGCQRLLLRLALRPNVLHQPGNEIYTVQSLFLQHVSSIKSNWLKHRSVDSISSFPICHPALMNYHRLPFGDWDGKWPAVIKRLQLRLRGETTWCKIRWLC